MGGALGCGPSASSKVIHVNKFQAMRDVGKDYNLNEKKKKQIEQAWDITDLDGSGYIDYDEFVASFALKDGSLTRSLWKHYDKDSSGTLDFCEFITRLAEQLSIKTMAERAVWAFDIYDLDRNGSLSLLEIEKCLNDKNVGIPWDRTKLKALFSEQSVKKDSITREEFIEVAKTCSTLVFPAFVMLDTVNSKAFEYEKSKKRPDAGKDYMKGTAATFKRAEAIRKDDSRKVGSHEQ